MALPDIRVRDWITFEWIDDPSTPNPRWRARMSREVFAALVKEKLGTDRGGSFFTTPPRRAADHFPRPRRRDHTHKTKKQTII